MLDQMQGELATAGSDAVIVAINSIDASGHQTQLTDRCAFPLFQDTAAVGAWDLHAAGKDDMLIYDRDGKLVQYLPFGGAVNTTLSTAEGYDNVKNAILAVP